MPRLKYSPLLMSFRYCQPAAQQMSSLSRSVLRSCVVFGHTALAVSRTSSIVFSRIHRDALCQLRSMSFHYNLTTLRRESEAQPCSNSHGIFPGYQWHVWLEPCSMPRACRSFLQYSVYSSLFCFVFVADWFASSYHLLYLQFEKFEDATSGSKVFDMTRANMAIKLSMGCLQFVFVNAFLQRMLVS